MDSFTPERESREAQRLGRLGNWSWRLSTNEVLWSAELYRIFGIDRKSKPPLFAEHGALVSADSWLRLQQVVATLLSDGTDYCVELEYRTPAGEAGWVESRGEPIRNEAGLIVGLRGTCLEISERVRRVRVEMELQLTIRDKENRDVLLRHFSEEIRTALNGVTGFASLLRPVVKDSAKHQQWIDRIIAGSDKIVELLKNMEDASEQLPDSDFAQLVSFIERE